MALQIVLDRTAETGDSYPVAYWRIDGFRWDRGEGFLVVQIGVYRDQPSASKQPVVSRTFTATGAAVGQILTANDIRAAIYVWLKTLGAFAGATDV